MIFICYIEHLADWVAARLLQCLIFREMRFDKSSLQLLNRSGAGHELLKETVDIYFLDGASTVSSIQIARLTSRFSEVKLVCISEVKFVYPDWYVQSYVDLEYFPLYRDDFHAAMVTRMRALSSGLQRLLDAFLGMHMHTCTYINLFISGYMILYAYVGGTDCMFYKRNLMSFYSFEALQEGLKHLVEIWSAVWLVDGGGVANDINDAAELHQAAEQAALILHVDNSQSGPHASIHVWCDTDSIKPWYKPKIHISGDSWSILYRPQEPSSAAWLRRASQMKYGVKVFWGTGWDSRIHCWRCFHRLPGPGAATGQEECWSWRRWGWVCSK